MSDYELTDSDYDYDENEKILLNNARQKPEEDSEEEVFNLQSSDNDSFKEDIEDNEDELPSSKAWGKRKRDYYNTDYVDEDFGGFQGKDGEKAEFEEQEARAIQERLLEEIDDNDYMLDSFKQVQASVQEEKAEEKIEIDISGLSKREKLALFAKESPEFIGLVEDFKVKIEECDKKLLPILKLVEAKKIPNLSVINFIKTKYDLCMSYCTNIMYYLLLKSQRVPIQTHPVIKRIVEHRQFLKLLERLDKKVLPQIDIILQKVKNGDELEFAEEKSSESMPPKGKIKKKATVDNQFFLEGNNTNVDLENEKDMETNEDQDEDERDGEDSRRRITYQIAKNKGLTPHRKKENRNPRVKYRNKFQKAKIRRKGQVREPRTELKRYGGEISGIKIGISKSIKLK